MSASKKAVKKPAAKSAAPKAKTKAKPADAKKATAASASRKPAAKAQKVNTAGKNPAAKAKVTTASAKAPAPKAKAPAASSKAASVVKKPAANSKPKAAEAKPKAVAKGKKAAPAKSAPAKHPAGAKTAPKAKGVKETASANPVSKPQAKPAAAESGTKGAAASAPAPKSETAAKAKPAPKKAKYIFVKQSSSSKQDNNAPELDAKTKELVLNARKRTANGAAPKGRAAKGSVIAFTMDDVVQALAKKQSESQSDAALAEKTPATKVVKKQEVELEAPQEKRVHSAVSLSDILGFNPAQKKNVNVTSKGREVPRKWNHYYKLLINLRDQVSSVLEQHTAETLKRSNRDDSGDLSGYGQHMADAGTDTFDRDFALSMVSSEQEALFEINEAIERIYNGSYGVCEITGETISAERLEAVPFTRYSLEGQKELEKNKRQKIQRGGVFSDNEDNISFDEDEN